MTRGNCRARFSVLGPLEVADRGEIISIPAAKQRIILATLLLRPNQFVSVDELIERMWDGDEPAPGRGAVHTHIGRLRRTLADQGVRQFIQTRELGYIAEFAADELDLMRHRHLVDLAATERKEGRAAEEADALAAALALWRPTPLSNVRSHLLHAIDVPLLVEERLRTLERWGELALRLGRYDEMITQMKAALMDNPTRERLTAQLMLALSRSGRQAEALEAYKIVVELLREELGVEPGAELRETYLLVLRQDARAGPEPRVTSSGTEHAERPDEVRSLSGEMAKLLQLLTELTPTPAEVPAVPHAFTGRSAPLQRVHALLTAERRRGVIAITGAGGVGKSALAIRAAHRAAEHFPDGSIYVDLGGSTLDSHPATVRYALGRILRSLGVNPSTIPSDVEEAAGRLRSLTSGKRLLLVLDNASHPAQVHPLLPAGPGSRVLITSRRAFTSLDVSAVERLDPLLLSEAVAMLRTLIGARRADSDLDALTQIAHLCECLPLALRVAARRLAARPNLPVRALAAQLGDERQRLPMLSDDDGGGVRSMLMVSYRALDSVADGVVATRLLRLLAVRDLTSTDPSVAASLAGLTEQEAQLALDQLAGAHLVEVASAGLYRLPALVRLFARELAHEVTGFDTPALACHG
ncbi:BTAD domain-containing putative transcriptional regulator [Nonomuraea sp. NPDC050404]|uniref:AfsR/SARP family transcriptional regulator n=1 Tax=Nonomuraea sp. NPDC050404 TaxID=3155783 RepID=UPI003408B069